MKHIYRKSQLKTITRIIFILVVLSLILVFVYSKYGSIGKALTDMFNFGDETDYGVLNLKAKKGFEIMVNDINNCIKSKDSDCGCEINMEGFTDSHSIKPDGHKISLLNIKDENEITIDDSDFKSLNCYITSNLMPKQTGASSSLRFDKGHPYITDLDTSDSELTNKFNIYKKGQELCWLPSTVKYETGNKIKKCQL